MDRQAQIKEALSCCNVKQLGDLLLLLPTVNEDYLRNFILQHCQNSSQAQVTVHEALLGNADTRSDSRKLSSQIPAPDSRALPDGVDTPIPALQEELGDDDEDFGISSSDEIDLLNLSQIREPENLAVLRKRKSNVELGSTSKRARNESGTNTALDVARSILQTTFGMEDFRLKQKDAIARLLKGDSAVIIFPTGGGKSLCYQLPALCFRKLDEQVDIRKGSVGSGITLVVSPLIALMKDQVDALQHRGISAAVLDSTKSQEEYRATMDSMRNGTLDILYCAPERLNNEGFVASMANVRGGVRLLAVDEAHCISEWGHAFRPDYLKVARFAKEIEAERVVCLTATATPEVAQDVCNAFSIPKQGLFRTSSYRPNLRLRAESYLTKKQSYPKLRKFLTENPGPTIIYVTLQKHTEELAMQLKSHGFKTASYHAGMDKDDRARCQNDFMASYDLIVVATIAFGMGIDKSNIRNVVHYDIPRSLEGYSQEIGRAGRDGHQSQCILYLCAEDLHLRESFARGDLPSKSSVTNLLTDVFSTEPSSQTDPVIEISLYNQSRDFDIKPTVLNNIYAQLELRFNLLRATTPKYSKYSYNLLTGPLGDKSPVSSAILNAARKAKTLYHVDVDAAARQSGLPRSDIVAKLNTWHDHKFIDLQAGGVINIYRVLTKLPSKSAERQKLADQLYRELELREQQELQRMAQVMSLITGVKCFSQVLASHFGDQLPNNVQECGHCTWCETKKPVEMTVPPQRECDSKAFSQVLEACPDRDDARFLARVAFGISSPRVVQSKLNRSPVFGSMEDHNFMTLLRAFEKVCQGKT